MTDLVLNISRFGYRSILRPSSAIYRNFTKPASKNEILIIGIALIIIQILDGVFTAIGVARFGSSVEANVFIRTLIEQWGSFSALLLVKTLAVGVVITLCSLSSRVPWVVPALKGVIILYLCAAIIPWSAILIMHA